LSWALINAANGVPPVAYGLLVWIEGACDWELNRRAGVRHAGIVRTGPLAPGALKFFDALAALLTGGGQKH
jgi:hypothetical protein